MLTKTQIRETVAALRPAAQAFERAKSAGYLSLDEECGWLVQDSLVPAPSDNPAQLELVTG